MAAHRTIILISGKQRSGKDTTAKLLKKLLKTDFEIASFATPIKAMYADMMEIPITSVDRLKNAHPDVRTSLINIGTNMRSVDINYWVDKVLKLPGNIIIPDLRYESEMDRVLEMTRDVFTVRVNADVSVRETRGVLSNESDPSEVDLDDYDWWDYVVDNDGCRGELEQQCEIIADSIDSYYSAPKLTAYEGPF